MALVQISQAQGRVPVTIFQLQDRVNLGNYKELEQTAQQAFDNGMRNLIIDLSQLSSLSSIGVRSLVVIHKMLAVDDAKHLKLAGLNEPIHEMLRVAGITQFIDVYDSIKDAISSF